MKPARLIRRSLFYYWRTNLPVIAGVAIAVAVLAGALMVGRSVRGSLEDLLFERIGNTETIVSAERFFHSSLADAFLSGRSACPIIYLEGVLIHEQTRARLDRVRVYGVDDRFWKFQGRDVPSFRDTREAFAGSDLARQLGVKIGDGLLLQVETQQSIPKEWLYGRREDASRTLRLSCAGILPPDKLGEFSLRPSQGDVYSLFVSMERLQKDLHLTSGANVILLSGTENSKADSIGNILSENLTLQDLGVRLKDLPSGNGFLLESNRILIPDSVARTAAGIAEKLGLSTSPVYTYMANAIVDNGRRIPYSAITAADLDKGALTSVDWISRTGESSSPDSAAPPIYLTDWAQKDLAASIGDAIEVQYYLWLEVGKLVTRTKTFRLEGVVSIGGDVNASLAPDIPGVTDARSMGEWNPPFPLNLRWIRKQDENYWNRYRATPKAFIPLALGQELWRNRFGGQTSIRFAPSGETNARASRAEFGAALLKRLNPESAGFVIRNIKESGVAASRGSTDFGEYFVYFSFFLIVAALLLSILFFRLSVEQRVREIGLLKVVGIADRGLQRLFFIEGLTLSVIGSILGLAFSILYGWLMVYGLRTWWVGAVGTTRLSLHFSGMDLAWGAIGGLSISLATIAWTLRGFRRSSPRSLLSGALESAAMQKRRIGLLGWIALSSAASAILLLAVSTLSIVSEVAGFFTAGFLSLAAVLCTTAYFLRRSQPRTITGNGWFPLLRLGIRNAGHRPGRSLLCAALIASATFIIVSTEAFHRDPNEISLRKDSGTGGYPFVADSTLPVIQDLNSAEGRQALGIELPGSIDPGRIGFVSFRERPGDDTSCLNLYTPQEPRILGAPDNFLKSGRFSFTDFISGASEEQKQNPWLLLDTLFPDGAIPAIADANTIQYILHLSLGGEFTLPSDDGSTVHLRLVAALKDSIFQGGILISETNFLRAFPNRQGYSFFLINTPLPVDAASLQPLKDSLAVTGIRIQSSTDLLSSYHRVENTYLSTFQSLGTLGLVLGTFGLATVLLRNVLERRSELALLRAAGYRRRALAAIVLSENLFLLLWGLGSGIVCALLAIAPALRSRADSPPVLTVLLVLLPVLVAGIAASFAAVIAVFRAPLLPALRSE